MRLDYRHSLVPMLLDCTTDAMSGQVADETLTGLEQQSQLEHVVVLRVRVTCTERSNAKRGSRLDGLPLCLYSPAEALE